MKYMTFLLALLITGCSGSKINSRPHDQKADYYTPVQFYDGFRNRAVYKGEIAEIIGGHRGGTIVLTNGRTYAYEMLRYYTGPTLADREYQTKQSPYIRQQQDNFSNPIPHQSKECDSR